MLYTNAEDGSCVHNCGEHFESMWLPTTWRYCPRCGQELGEKITPSHNKRRRELRMMVPHRPQLAGSGLQYVIWAITLDSKGSTSMGGRDWSDVATEPSWLEAFNVVKWYKRQLIDGMFEEVDMFGDQDCILYCIEVVRPGRKSGWVECF